MEINPVTTHVHKCIHVRIHMAIDYQKLLVVVKLSYIIVPGQQEDMGVTQQGAAEGSHTDGGSKF